MRPGTCHPKLHYPKSCLQVLEKLEAELDHSATLEVSSPGVSRSLWSPRVPPLPSHISLSLLLAFSPPSPLPRLTSS